MTTRARNVRIWAVMAAVMFVVASAPAVLAADASDPCTPLAKNLGHAKDEVEAVSSVVADRLHELQVKRTQLEQRAAAALEIADAIQLAPPSTVEAETHRRSEIRGALVPAAAAARGVAGDLKEFIDGYESANEELERWREALARPWGTREKPVGGRCVWSSEDLTRVSAALNAVHTKLEPLVARLKQLEARIAELRSLPDFQKSVQSVNDLGLSSAAQSTTESLRTKFDWDPVTLSPEGAGLQQVEGSAKRAAEHAGDALSETSNAENILTRESSLAANAAASKERIETARGDVIRYGLTATMLRFHVLRDPALPGRERSYEPELDVVPGEFGFQVTVAPHYSPLCLRTRDGKPFQVMSIGGMFLVDPDAGGHSSWSVAGLLSFLNDTIGVGIGFDLYRAIPVRGADGQPGSAVAHTGLLSWATSATGEMTPENLLFLVTLNASSVAKALGGTGEDE